MLNKNAEQNTSQDRGLSKGLSGIGSLTSIQKLETVSVKQHRPSVVSMNETAINKPTTVMSTSPSPHNISFRFGGSRDETSQTIMMKKQSKDISNFSPGNRTTSDFN